jgi:hypothetical protein
VKNYRQKTGNTVAVCEVAVRYQIVVELPETETEIKVKLKLKREGLNLPETELATGKSCSFYDNSFSFAALEPGTHKFTLEISDASIASGSQAVINGIQVRVEAFQTD